VAQAARHSARVFVRTNCPSSCKQKMPGRLEGKIALITGASSGIGAGCAKAFALEGADVAINYLDADSKEAAEQIAKEVEGAGKRSLLVEADVSKEEDVDQMVKKVTGHFGRIDILVNNAGCAKGPSPVHEMKVADFDNVMAVNFRSIFLCTRAVLPQMLERNDGGKIINSASQLAKIGAPSFSHYCASKGATIAFTRAVSLEIGEKNVNINCVAPGATHTNMTAGVPPEILEGIRQNIPKKRLADVADIVPSYVFLASDDAKHIVGQTISPNGGDAFH